MKTTTIRDWGQFICTIAQCTQDQGDTGLWWRGHAMSEWHLVPSLYRNSFYKYEQTLANTFKNRGKARHPSTPAHDDYVAWLFLAQHYRLPTRLLDWTTSPLLALYFAVAEGKHRKQPAAIWGLNPAKLNQLQGQGEGGTVQLARSPQVIPIIKAAFEMKKVRDSEKVLAVATEESDIRQMVQLSAFTIHGIPTALNQLPNANEFLVRLEIPADDREVFKQGLLMLGITESVVFPDLDHLASELSNSTFKR
jgi:hypothetical protein